MVRNKSFREILAEKMATPESNAEVAPVVPAPEASPVDVHETLARMEIPVPCRINGARSVASAYAPSRRPRSRSGLSLPPQTATASLPLRRAETPALLTEDNLSINACFALEILRRLGAELAMPLARGELKRAYRRLAHQLHPDRAGASSEEFLRLREAYETVMAEFRVEARTPAASPNRDAA